MQGGFVALEEGSWQLVWNEGSARDGGCSKGLLMIPIRSKQLSRSGCALCLVRGLHSTLIPKKYFSNLLQGGCVSPALINLGVTLLQSLYDSRLDNMPKLPELLCNRHLKWLTFQSRMSDEASIRCWSRSLRSAWMNVVLNIIVPWVHATWERRVLGGSRASEMDGNQDFFQHWSCEGYAAYTQKLKQIF